jgi:NTE family protein
VHGDEEIPLWKRVQRRGERTRIGLEHVMASCAIPLIFPAIEVEGEYYGDGSVRQSAPLAPAIHLGADRLLAVATRHDRRKRGIARRDVNGYPPPAQVLSMLFNAIFLDTLEADAERLNRINQLLASAPGSRPGGLRPIELLVIRPSLDLGSLALAYQNRLPRTLRFLLRGLGTHRTRSPDLLSYLIFEREYLSRLFELGYEDAHGEWSRIERFLAGEDRAA